MADKQEVKEGDRFKAGNSIYTITSINGKTVTWDCVGRKYWMKNVSIESIREWVEEGRLIKINI